MYIQTKIDGTISNEQEYELNVDRKRVIQLELVDEKGRTSKERLLRWHIYHNGLQVDEMDYTGGPKAELELLPEHGGSGDFPSEVMVELRNKHRSVLSTVCFRLSTQPFVEKVYWYNSRIDARGTESLEEKHFGYLGDMTKIEVYGKGLYEVPMVLKIWDASDWGMPRFSIQGESAAGYSVFNWRVQNPETKDKNYYFSLHLGEEEVYNGKEQGPEFTAKSIVNPNIEISAPQISVNPAVLYKEEYFTQRYEPCGYSGIELESNSNTCIKVFEEDKPQPNRSSEHHVSLLFGNSKNESITINLLNLDTDECFLETHQTADTIWDTEELDAESFEYEAEKSQIKIYATWNYPYLETGSNKPSNYLLFFLYNNPYALFNAVDNFMVHAQSCRYTKEIRIQQLPDLNWSIHGFWGQPTDRGYVYYRDFKGLDMQSGTPNLEKFVDFLLKMTPFVGMLSLRHFVKLYIKSMSADFALGLHAVGDYKNDMPSTVIDYTKQYPKLTEMILASYVILAITIDVLMLILTRGKNLPVILQKIQKVMKYGRTVLKFTGFSEHSLKDKGIYVHYPQFTKYTGAGYRELEENRYAFVLEHSVSASPLFSVGYKEDYTFGEFITNQVGISTFFKKARKNVSLVGKLKSLTGYVKKRLKKKLGIPESNKPDKFTDYIRSGDINEGLYYVEDRIVKYFDKLGKEYLGLESCKFEVSIVGFYEANYKLRFNLDDKSIEAEGADLSPVENGSVTYGNKQGIDFYANIDFAYKDRFEFSKINEYVPDFLPGIQQATKSDYEVASDTCGDLIGTYFFERTYNYGLVEAMDAIPKKMRAALHPSKIPLGSPMETIGVPEPVYTDRHVFTGLVATISFAVKVDRKSDEDWGNMNSDTIINEVYYKTFVLIEPFEYESPKQAVFPNPKTE
ncbi:MAG: hypothetical protein OIF50_16715 [Flavobacteriaceae bacterium]|nr:hypothetical protein [Flavobacteriaceae bacterium]